MELSSPSNPDVDPSSRPSRRKSGRVPKQTEFLSPAESAKRKRNADEAGEEGGDSDEDDMSDEDQNDNDPDEEELRERRRKQKSKASNKSKPAAKKQKPNGISVGTSATLVRRPAKKVTAARKGQVASAAEVGGLYGSVFAGDERLDSVSAAWVDRFTAHEANAVAELVNFVLRCAGCEHEVNGHDIEDPDNATNKLGDIQELLQAQAMSDYPLISRNKGSATFKKTLTSFINTFVHVIASKNLLTDQPELIENIQTWVGSMSSAPSRPLRHTAALVSLEITTALAELGKSANDNSAKITRQAEGERKNKKANQARVDSLRQSAEETRRREIAINGIFKDWFDVVFVHRYRDVDARVRVDCVTYLSEWILIHPDELLNGQHLRYLGWVLSDTTKEVRLQTVRDMQKLYQDDNKIGLLRQFTDKFRPRIVEMAARDGDLGVRCSSLELLNVLRTKGLLEPSDVESIGRLIFDSEFRVRNAVAPFFAAIVEDVYQDKRDEFEGAEEEAIADFEQHEDDDFEAHSLDWVRFKSIAELLQSYDIEDDSPLHIDMEAQAFNDTDDPIHSRVSLATEAIFDHVPCLTKWDSLAGLLIKDIARHANIADPSDIPSYIDNASQLETPEQVVLLDVLNVSVKHVLSTVIAETGATSKKSRKTKRELEALAEAQEAAAQRLASVIPKLLRKFGESPVAAAAVLRLQAVLNLDVFSQLREDSTTFSNLLEDIRRQFMSHEAAPVIQSAKRALLHARGTDELEEVASGKLSVLWDDTTLTLARLCKNQDLTIRGSLHSSLVGALSTTVMRIANLASICDCVEALEKAHNISQKTQKKFDSGPATITPIGCLSDMVQRGILDEDSSDALEDADAAVEDGLVSNAIKALGFYFSWQVVHLRAAGEAVTTPLPDILSRFTSVQTSLRTLIGSRHGADSLRTEASVHLLDNATTLSTLRHTAGNDVLEALNLPSSARLPTQARKAVLGVFIAVERDYARKAGKTLVDPSEDTAEDQAETQRQEEEALEAEPESSDDEADEDGDVEDVEAQARAQAKQNKKDKAALLAEKDLCTLAAKLMFAVEGGCIDDSGATKKRVLRNRSRFGKSYAEVLATFEKEKEEKQKTKIKTKGARPQVRTPVVEEPDEMDEDPIEEDGEEDLRRRELAEPEADGGEEGGAEEGGVNDEPESVLGD